MRPGEVWSAPVKRILRALAARRGRAVHVFVFGDCRYAGQVRGLFEQADVRTPITWVEGESCLNEPLAGVQLHAVGRGCAVDYFSLSGRVVAARFHDGEAMHCLVGGIGPRDAEGTPCEQPQGALDQLDAALRVAGFALEDVARTWFYNDEILAWYDEFNRVRTARCRECQFTCGSLPASTAVSGKNPQGAALTVAAWAVRPDAGVAGKRVREVASPLQCPAPQYGSAFSRATLIETGGTQRLLVSGTASIEPGGKTVHVGDVPKQIELSMDVIAAILQAQGMTWDDVTRASAYCKQPEYLGVFLEWQRRHGLSGMPMVPVHCDICRGDLLFELELDAVRAE